jgi:hypothetical protein
MKHTSGPWVVAAWTSHGRIICTPKDEHTISKYIGYAQGYPTPDDLQVGLAEAEGNARLMASAPELLSALVAIELALRKDSRNKSILGDEVEYHLDGQTMGYAIQTAREAIRKAKGSE